MFTEVRVGDANPRRAVVRNLSSAGLMGEMDEPPQQGETVSFELGTIGWVSGIVVWNLGNRFGVQFASEIQPDGVLPPAG